MFWNNRSHVSVYSNVLKAVSKKRWQFTVVIQYSGLSPFFWNRRHKIRYILDELYLAVTWIIIRLIIYIDQLNTAYKILLLVIASTNPNFVNMKYTVNWLETCLKRELRMLRLRKSIPKTKYTNLILNKNKNAPFPMVEIYISIKCFVLKKSTLFHC